MFEGTDSMLSTQSVSSNVSYNSFKTQNLPMKNSHCDHRNFDSVVRVRLRVTYVMIKVIMMMMIYILDFTNSVYINPIQHYVQTELDM